MITLTATDIFMTTMTKNIDVCIDTTSKESRQWSLYQVVLLSMQDLKCSDNYDHHIGVLYLVPPCILWLHIIAPRYNIHLRWPFSLVLKKT